jgi:hypothetical protein
MVANKGWCEAFSDVEVVIGPAICSDHSPLSVFLLGHSEGKREDHETSSMKLDGNFTIGADKL